MSQEEKYSLHVKRVDDAPKETVRYLKDELFEYSERFVTDPEVARTRRFRLLLRDEQHNVYGGIVGSIAWKSMKISTLWIREDYRGLGYGKVLIEKAEEEAVKEQCRLIMLETTSFHAHGFYLKMGYEEVGNIADFPEGHTFYLMIKRLIP